jgi:transposase
MEEGNMVTQKIRIYPSKEQKELFRKCFGAHRFFYNKTVALINKKYEDKKKEFNECKTCVHCKADKLEEKLVCEKHIDKPLPWKLNISLISLRKEVMSNDEELKEDEFWQKEIPYDTRQLAIKDCVSAYKSCITNKIRGNIQQFKLNFISRNKPSKIFWVDDGAVKIKNTQIHIFQRRLNKNCILRTRKQEKEKLPEKIESDSKILYDRGAYYLVITKKQDKVELVKKEDSLINSIALDPGVRTFQTGYSPDGTTYKMGEYQIQQMKTMHKKIDTLKSIKDTTKKRRTKYNLKKKILKLEFKLFNITNNLHNQCASMLSRTYNNILLPTFGTSKMLQGDLCSTVNRRLQGLSHYRFQQKIKHLCKKYNSNLYLVDESFTTKTCGCCGNIKEDVGSSKVYNCDKCLYTCDRDIHGARNIWLKTYSEYGTMMYVPQTFA